MATFDQGKERQAKKQYAYQKFISLGYTPIQAAGIVGNLDIESGFSDDVIKGNKTGDNGTAFGIAQWRNDRQDRFRKMYKDPTNFDSQLEYVNWELRNTHRTALSKLNQAKNVDEATSAITWDYEKPSSDPKLNHFDKRIASARELIGVRADNNFNSSTYVPPTPGNLETSTTEYQEEPEVVQAKQDIAEKSLAEDFYNTISKQQEQIDELRGALQKPVNEEQNQQEEPFQSIDMQDPYNYINLDPGYNFEEFQKGGKIIKDNAGQWTHPGEITEINSPNITMKNVGYSVLGISKETGERKMMYPEQEYFFQNTNNVIEIPITSKRFK